MEWREDGERVEIRAHERVFVVLTPRPRHRTSSSFSRTGDCQDFLRTRKSRTQRSAGICNRTNNPSQPTFTAQLPLQSSLHQGNPVQALLESFCWTRRDGFLLLVVVASAVDVEEAERVGVLRGRDDAKPVTEDLQGGKRVQSNWGWEREGEGVASRSSSRIAW